MSASLARASSSIVVELHEALSELDRRRRVRVGLAVRIGGVREQLRTLNAEEAPGLPARLAALADALDAPPTSEKRSAWLAFRARVQPVYEAVVADLRAERVDVPSLRPTNYARNLLHVASSVGGLLTLTVYPSYVIPLVISVTFMVAAWTLEISRKQSPRVNEACMKLFGRTAHPHEAHRINSATWYATALVVLAASGFVPACAVGLLSLGIGDPAAAIVGRKLGKTKLMHGRTLEGTLAFVIAGGLSATLFLALAFPGYGLALNVTAAFVGALAGALAELASRRVDDNLTIPLAAFAASGAVFALLA
jgi:dolichol kinase